jgi:glycine cleavage system transcriptional repressor
MSIRAIVSISCVSQSGLLTTVTECLAARGCNLADTTFAVLSGSAEFTTICEMPEGMAEETLALELHRLPALAGAKVIVSPFDPVASEARSQRITHRFEFSGPDKAGKILRLSKAMTASGATVMRLNSQRSIRDGAAHSTIRIAVTLADDRSDAALAAVADTAGELGLTCRVEKT